jgi:hypothetical protein
MRRLLYYLLYPLIWFLELINDWKEYGFKHGVWEPFTDSIENFFYDHHHNGVFGPGGHGWRTFKSGNLALLIAICTAIAFIIYVIVV